MIRAGQVPLKAFQYSRFFRTSICIYSHQNSWLIIIIIIKHDHYSLEVKTSASNPKGQWALFTFHSSNFLYSIPDIKRETLCTFQLIAVRQSASFIFPLYTHQLAVLSNLFRQRPMQSTMAGLIAFNTSMPEYCMRSTLSRHSIKRSTVRKRFQVDESHEVVITKEKVMHEQDGKKISTSDLSGVSIIFPDVTGFLQRNHQQYCFQQVP